MSELFEVLKNRPTDAHQMDTDSIAASLRVMSQHLDKLHPEMQGIFGKIITQTQAQLENLRSQRFNGYEVFCGKGPVARKILEHIALQQIFSAVNSPRADEIRSQMDDIFNKYPTRDEAELKDLKSFVEMVAPLMTGQVLPGQEFVEIPLDAKISEQKSGFYKVKGPVLDRFVMVLKVSTGRNGIKACYVLERGHDEYLLLNHPEEHEWYKSDYSYSFENLTSMLRQELDALLVPMNFSAKHVDLQFELSKIAAKVDNIFDSITERKVSGVDMLVHEMDQSIITMRVSPQYYWSFTDTRGKWPSRTYKFYHNVAGSPQSAEPTVFNEFSRQTMVRYLNTELDRIAEALKLPEAV